MSLEDIFGRVIKHVLEKHPEVGDAKLRDVCAEARSWRGFPRTGDRALPADHPYWQTPRPGDTILKDLQARAVQVPPHYDDGGALVYFIVAVDAPGFVKIGHAMNPTKRMRAFKCSHPTATWTLLATMPGGVVKEQELHNAFHPFRHRGEWFRLVPEIQALIEKVK